MATSAKPKKFTQELARKIVNTRGVVKADRDRALRALHEIVDTGCIDESVQCNTLSALQIAVRDEQVWDALEAARAALKPPKPPT